MSTSKFITPIKVPSPHLLPHEIPKTTLDPSSILPAQNKSRTQNICFGLSNFRTYLDQTKASNLFGQTAGDRERYDTLVGYQHKQV